MENKASDSPVCLRVASLCACKHNVKHKECKQNSEHSNKLQNRSGLYVAVLFFSYRLNQSSEHNANAEKVTDICEMHVKSQRIVLISSKIPRLAIIPTRPNVQ